MGSIYSVHLLFHNSIRYQQKCLICWEPISVEYNVFVKCNKCKNMLHKCCGLTYRSDDVFIKCPYCNRNGSLFLYDNSGCVRL